MEVHRTDIQLEGVSVEVSTSDLDYLGPPETCLFWVHRDRRESVVVEQYDDWVQAVQGHVNWTADVARIAQVVAEYRRGQTESMRQRETELRRRF
ncbi:hypothetical protein KHO57_gp030 [Mycobacterium phage Phabba]|uniref:Uncharacterized protein n=1 Tax=Mycobacterium phage Phabba TaxID=2027899 RepID=A0A249XS93_9CAUD|nr:hypothetical protein KHO57_gp030 [Mycobacterium phage Phabba]ASZ74605.1 hypothetical protein SEA_PHABBA_30 [Mycobacterium phage Phabba]